MKRTGLALMLLATAPAAAQMHPVRPVTVPDVAPILRTACLPVAGGQPVAAGIAAAKSLGFAVTATHGDLATLEKERMMLNLGPRYCVLTLSQASPAFFPHVDHELVNWLPRLGRYWQGGLEADAAGLTSRKFRAGGQTWQVGEQVDEDERQLIVNVGK